MTQNSSPFVAAYLLRNANVSAPIRCHDIVYLVTGDGHPFAVHFDFVMITDHTALGLPAIRQAATPTLGWCPSEFKRRSPDAISRGRSLDVLLAPSRKDREAHRARRPGAALTKCLSVRSTD